MRTYLTPNIKQIQNGKRARELCDSLMQEGKDPFSVWLMNQFAGSKHKILFLSTSANVQHFLKNE